MRIYLELNPEKALIFRITHLQNVPWILDHGMHCRSSEVRDPSFVSIGNDELIEKRAAWPVPTGPRGTLSDYVPFYFTPFSPMLYNIKTGWGGIQRRSNEEIVILVSSLPELGRKDVAFVFTDRHACLKVAAFSTDLSKLGAFVPWPLLQKKDFAADPEHPDKKERYQAEALVHQHVPIDAILGIVCYSPNVKSDLDVCCAERGLRVPTYMKRGWYFS